MTVWRRVPGTQVQYAPIAIRAIDDFTGGPPIVEPDFVLDRKVATDWVETDLASVRTPSGLVIWPGLGRVRVPAAEPVAHYRVRFVDLDNRCLYRPAFAFQFDGLEFDVHPWSATSAPASLLNRPELVYLSPGVGYPFPPSVPVLRGRTLDATNKPLVDARVTGATDNVLSDARGAYALPIRSSTALNSIVVTADHQRSGRAGNVTVALPADLGAAVDIQLV